MDSTDHLLVRLTGAVAFCLNMAGFVVINERRTKLLLATCSATWGAQYALLGQHTGLAIMLLAACRQALSAYTIALPGHRRRLLAWLFTVAALVVTALTWQSPLASLLPMVATIMGTWAFFVLSNTGMRKLTMVSNLVWALHGYLFNSWELCLTMLVLTGATLLGLWRLAGAKR